MESRIGNGRGALERSTRPDSTRINREGAAVMVANTNTPRTPNAAGSVRGSSDGLVQSR
jgi:hypothetical protein